MNQPKEILKKYWGHDSFRDLQEEIIQTVLDKKDTVALLPTGGGKSVCYQIPGIISEGVCLVISPLISLMKDQVESLQKKGIQAITLESKLSTDDIVMLFDNLKYGNAKFLYISPERLQSSLIIQKLKELNISHIAVDEAHCISEWGHDFRPSYRQIKNIRQFFPDTNIIALTATATKKVIDDIKENLEMPQTSVYKKSFYRDNLAYQVFTKENKLERLVQILVKNPTPTIVYVNSRKKTEELAKYINSKGFKTVSYHGGMSAEDKLSSFNYWMSEERPIIIATNAFGMGIDKPNVRIVVHMDLPYSIENYIQEAGRGGRDGNKAFSVVLQNESDILAFKKNTIDQIPSMDEIKDVHKKLYKFFHVAKGEKVEESLDFNFQEFCDRYELKPRKTVTILGILKNHGIIDLNQKFLRKSRLQIIMPSQQLMSFKSKNQLTMSLIELLLRSYGNIFHHEVKISEFILSKKLKTTSTRVKKVLQKLDDKKVIKYKEVNSNQDLFLLLPREDDKTINRFAKNIKGYIHQQQKKAKDLIRFVQNDHVCRSQQILYYFDEETSASCGMCDVCIRNKSTKTKDLSKQIIEFLGKEKLFSHTEIIEHLEADEESILIHLRNLLKKDIISITEDNKLYMK
ncbi:RecQ family ATP-dependent DNA helicase [Pseudotenacibaculum haliotis]|uniref:ATP-dependent DNA helicase RecQ n=1 Tax=Pseudotenacibaculum haliotis TaxID=1862138 RepID=A0ABW5LYJ0_9FLAO